MRWALLSLVFLGLFLVGGPTTVIAYGEETCDYSPSCTEYTPLGTLGCATCQAHKYTTACTGGCDYSSYSSACYSRGTCSYPSSQTVQSSCPTGQVINQVCSSSTCTWTNSGSCYCSNPVCSIGQTQCYSSSQVKTCDTVGNCPGWVTTTCPSGVCSGNACVACSNDCSAGDTSCSGNSVVTCGQCDADTCLDWCNPVSCGSSATCVSGACKPNCAAQGSQYFCGSSATLATLFNQ